MKDIFTDLYNKVLGFFKQTEKQEVEESAKDVACNRLKFVLMQDRTNLTPELMDRMRKELVELLSKYVEMDKEALELGFEQEGNQMALMLSIPVVRAKDEAEIEAALAKEDEEKEAKATEQKDDDEEISDKSDSDETKSEDESIESDENIEIIENDSSDEEIETEEVSSKQKEPTKSNKNSDKVKATK